MLQDVTAELWGQGRLLLFHDLVDQAGEGNEYDQELEQLVISNHIHIHHPLSRQDRGQEASPPEQGAEPPTVVRSPANHAGGNRTITYMAAP